MEKNFKNPMFDDMDDDISWFDCIGFVLLVTWVIIVSWDIYSLKTDIHKIQQSIEKVFNENYKR